MCRRRSTTLSTYFTKMFAIRLHKYNCWRRSSESVVPSVTMPSNFRLPTPIVVMNPPSTVVPTTAISQLPTSPNTSRSSSVLTPITMATQNQFPLPSSLKTTPTTTVLTSVASSVSIPATGLKPPSVLTPITMATQLQFSNPSVHVTTPSVVPSDPMGTQGSTNASPTASLQSQLSKPNAVPGTNTEQSLPHMTGKEELLQQRRRLNIEDDSNASIDPKTLPDTESSSLGEDLPETRQLYSSKLDRGLSFYIFYYCILLDQNSP